MKIQIKLSSLQVPNRHIRPEALTNRSCVRENAAGLCNDGEKSAAFSRTQLRFQVSPNGNWTGHIAKEAAVHAPLGPGQSAALPKIPHRRGSKTFLPTLLAAWLLGATALASGGEANPDAGADASSRNTPAEQAELESPTLRHETDDKDPKKFEKVMGMTIGLVAVVMGIGIAFFAVWYDYKKRHEIITACHQERMAALEKGLEPPPYPPDWLAGHPKDLDNPRSPLSGLKDGVFWLAIGVGAAIFLSLQRRAGIHPSIGAIPIAIGIAYLICYVLETRRPNA